MKSKRPLLTFIAVFVVATLVGLLLRQENPAPIPTPFPATRTAHSGPTNPPKNPLPGAAGIGDSYFPLLGNGGYDALHYTLDLDVDMANNSLSGTAEMQALATQDLSSFNLDFYGMTISAIQVNGVDASYARADRELTITPTTPISMADPFSVTVTYSGVPGAGLPSGLPAYEVGWTHYGHGILVAGEPSGNSVWYPVNEHPLDKATYSFEITVAKPYSVAANGVLLNTLDHGDSATFVWESFNPIASYLVTLAIAEFEIETTYSPDGLPIRNYFGVGVSNRVRRNFSVTGDMIAYFTTIFGPYPFEAYGVVVHDLNLNFALETQTLSVFGRTFNHELVVSHELAHQWFGNSVGLESWQDIWLNEGFAYYASILWKEHSNGEPAALREISQAYAAVASGENAGETENFSPPGAPPAEHLFNSGVYLRGALVLQALRIEVGDQAFFDVLRTYFSRYHNSNASTADFIAVAEEVSQQDLGAFFDDWLYNPVMPDIPALGLYHDDFSAG
ncbi:MAG: M1 family metallopeptidase [Anaerolineae bacterium]|nr:M1 family metallopeptidase [Anaerolineae bacterium]